MDTPNIFIVKPEHIKGNDVSYVLRQALAAQFSGKEYFIVNEITVDKPTHYSRAPRKLRGFLIEEGGNQHSIYFDITEVSAANAINWLGSH